MSRKIFVSLCLLLSTLWSHLGAGENLSQRYDYPDYNTAVEAPSKIIFKIKSTKFGLITSEVVGALKSFAVSGELEAKGDKKIITGAKIQFPVAKMDTDSESRDEKMHDYCLAFKQHPEIQIIVPVGLMVGNALMKLNAEITIRGKKHEVPVEIRISEMQNKLEVFFNAQLSFKNLEIPDPSIAIASVDDVIEVTGSFWLFNKKE